MRAARQYRVPPARRSSLTRKLTQLRRGLLRRISFGSGLLCRAMIAIQRLNLLTSRSSCEGIILNIVIRPPAI